MSSARVHGWSPAPGGVFEPNPTSSLMSTFRVKCNRDAWSPLDKPSPTSSASSVLTEFHQCDDAPLNPPRRGDPGYIPRPRNAFVIFRCDFCKKHLASMKKNGGTSKSRGKSSKTLSKIASETWKALSEEEKRRYDELAKKEKAEHARCYPHYKYRPLRRGRVGVARTARRGHVLARSVYADDDGDDDSDYVPSPRLRVSDPPVVEVDPPSSPPASSPPPSSVAPEASPASRPRPTSWMSAMPVRSAHYTIPEGVDVQKTEPLFLSLPQHRESPPPAQQMQQPSLVQPLEAVAATLGNWSYDGPSPAQGAPSYSMTPSTASPYPSSLVPAYNDATQISTSGAQTPAHAFTNPSYDASNAYAQAPVPSYSYADQVSYVDQASYASSSSGFATYAAPVEQSYQNSGTVNPAFVHAPLSAEDAHYLEVYNEMIVNIQDGDAGQYYNSGTFGDASAHGFAAAAHAGDAPTWSIPHDSGAPAALPFDAAGYDATDANAGAYNTFAYGDAYNHGPM
ncbi:hypothetical protein K523DRAFT_232081 [Schizophyllum commune Tattone D]|nr:hypothetical protein K523DRAFT_232081 [Schizophyllum commune Tattone D]